MFCCVSATVCLRHKRQLQAGHSNVSFSGLYMYKTCLKHILSKSHLVISVNMAETLQRTNTSKVLFLFQSIFEHVTSVITDNFWHRPFDCPKIPILYVKSWQEQVVFYGYDFHMHRFGSLCQLSWILNQWYSVISAICTIDICIWTHKKYHCLKHGVSKHD